MTSLESPETKKVYWADIRKHVKKLNPELTQIIDQISPNNTFPLFLTNYSYGAFIKNHKGFCLPNGYLNNPNIQKHLGYGANSLPLSLVLEKNCEAFIDLEQEQLNIPETIYKPGSFLGLEHIHNKHTASPSLITSGTRSVFILPSIGCAKKYATIQRKFHIHSPLSKHIYEHWFLFKELVKHPAINCSWHSSIIYFSENWINHICRDSAWLPLKAYLQNAYLNEMNQYKTHHHDIIFSTLQKNYNLKPNPYLVDTAKHLFKIGLSLIPGYAPAINNDSLPLKNLTNIFIHDYQLPYTATIMQPAYFEKPHIPVYYSLYHPSTYSFSPKARKSSSTLFELRELHYILQQFTLGLKNMDINLGKTLQKIAQQIQFHCFHNQHDRHEIILPSHQMPLFDPRFLDKTQQMAFSADAPFVRGCVGIY